MCYVFIYIYYFEYIKNKTIISLHSKNIIILICFKVLHNNLKINSL